MDNRLWTAAILLILTHHEIFYPANAHELKSPSPGTWGDGLFLNFPEDFGNLFAAPLEPSGHIGHEISHRSQPAVTSQSESPELFLNFPEDFDEFLASIPEPSHPIGHEISPQFQPAAIGKPESTQPTLRDGYVPPLDSPAQSQALQYSAQNNVVASTSHDEVPVSYLEGTATKRTKIQVSQDQHFLNPSNLIPASHEFTVNAHSPPFEGPYVASTPLPTDQNIDGPGLFDSMILPTGVQYLRDDATSSITNQPYKPYPTGIHEPNNLKQKPRHNPGHPIRTSHGELGIPELHNNNNDETAIDSNHGNSQTQAKKTRKEKSDDLIPASCQKHPPDDSLRTYGVVYRWVDFKPSTIDGQLVMEALDSVRNLDGTKFFHFLAVLSHAQELDGTRENQLPTKLFCLHSLVNRNFDKFFDFYTLLFFKDSSSLWLKVTPALVEKTKLIFTQDFSSGDTHLDGQGRILAYKTFVLRDFEQLIDKYKKTKVTSLDGENIPLSNFTCFQKAVNLFPLYLFYINLISALLPIQAHVMGGQLLKEQRQIAGPRFFELLHEAISNAIKGDLITSQNDRRSKLIENVTKLLQSKRFGYQERVLAFIWRALENWIITSRKDLTSAENFPGKNFKVFFNKLVYSWVDRQESPKKVRKRKRTKSQDKKTLSARNL